MQYRPKRENTLIRSTIKSGSSNPLDLKWNPRLEQVFDQPKKLKTKSKKFPTFLQFLLYQDLYSSRNQSFRKQQSVRGASDWNSNKAPTGIKSNLKVWSEPTLKPSQSFIGEGSSLNSLGDKKTNFLNHLLISDLDSTLANNFSYTNRKWSSFFPYKKSFLCYWLLPVVGFVGYVSTQDIRQAFLLEKQTGNLGWSISLKSSSGALKSASEKQAFIASQSEIGKLHSNITNEDFLMFQPSLQKKQSISTNLNPVFLFSTDLKLSFKDNWYKTSLIYNSVNGQLMAPWAAVGSSFFKNNTLYPDKFYDTPLTYIPFTSSVQTKESVNKNSLNLNHKMKDGTFALSELKNNFLPKKTKFVFKKVGTSVKLTPQYYIPQELKEETNYLLGISSKLFLRNNFWGETRSMGDQNKDKESGNKQVHSNIPFTNILNPKVWALPTLMPPDPKGLGVGYFLPTFSPVFSYKKAMFLMDEYAKALIVSGSPLNSNLNKLSLENLKKGMKMLPFIVNLPTHQGAKVPLPLGNGLIFKYKVYNSKIFQKTVSVTASNESNTNLSFLDRMISFLLSESSKGINSNTALGLKENPSQKTTVITKKEYSSHLQLEDRKDGSTFDYTPLTQSQGSALTYAPRPQGSGGKRNLVNKLTKDQLYFIILNSLSFKQNGTYINPLSPDPFRKGSGDLSVSVPLTLKRGVNENKTELSTSTKLLKLNHPLFFASTPQSESPKPVLKPSNFQNNESFSQLANSSPSTKLDKNTSFYYNALSPDPLGSGDLSVSVPLTLKVGATGGLNVHGAQNVSVEQQSKNDSILSSRTKYVNYLSLRLKQILTPLYSSVFLKDKGFNLSRKAQVPLKNSEKIFRSYLSKKRMSFKKVSHLNLSKIKGSGARGQVNPVFNKTVISKKVTLFTIQGKTKSLLGKNQSSSLTPMPGINSLRSSFKKPLQPKKNSLKSYTINSLLKNRVFLLKKKKPANLSMKLVDNVQLGTYLLNPVLGDKLQKEENNINKLYFLKLEKNKYAQKKHRRKKQRKETRRRKKRKRFYPRPIWSRNKTYQNILLKLSLSEVQKPSVKVHSEKLIKKVYKSTKSHSFNFNSLVENLPLYSTKDFYQIKRSVLGELKRAFWKSYWLRSNLNPYLNEIKSNLKQIEKAATKETLYSNLQSLIMSVSGLNEITNRMNMGSLVSEHKSMNSNFNIKENRGDLQFDTAFPNLYTNLYFLNKQEKSGDSPNFGNQVIVSTNILSTPNKWQLITQIAEHNRIMYERIQNLILNIRENLTLSGQFKARAYKRSGRLKFKSLATLKQVNPNNPQTNPDFWSKLGKTTASIFSQSSIKYYGDLSNNRLYWAMHKSNLASFKTVNKMKSLWASTKNRDQSKANKTKKIFYDIQKKYASFLNYSFIKEKFNLDNQLWLNQKSPDFETADGAPLSVFKGGNPFSNELKSALLVSQRKIRHKEQKLISLGLNGKQFPSPKGDLYSSSKAPGIGKMIKQPYGLVMKDSLMLPGHIQKLTNQSVGAAHTYAARPKGSGGKITYWWTGSQMKMIPTFSTNSTSLNSSLVNFSSNLTVLGAITFIFHFCAVVSLISISQIRDFIKFILIVVSKVSKIYSQLIFSSFNAFGLLYRGIPLGSMGLDHKTKMYQYKGFNMNLNSEEFTNKGSLKINSSALSGSVPLTLLSPDPKGSGDRRKKFNSASGKMAVMPHLNPAIGSKKVSYSVLVTIFKKLLTGQTVSSKKLVLNPKTEYSPFKLFKSVYSIILYSGINALIFSLSNLSLLTYSYFLKSLNIVEICIRSIYTFFEKPGELIIDWMAYFFLVEWSSDLTNTIPDTVDTAISTSITKLSRSAARTEVPVFQSINLLVPPLLNTISFNTPFIYSSVLMPTAHFNKSLQQMTLENLSILPSFSNSFLGIFSFLSGGLIQRRILSMYDIFVTIACRPDTDLITRQQKGYIFGDLWSDLLIGVAEDSNINVSELSNLKEEQNRLLEKLLSLPTPGVAHTLSMPGALPLAYSPLSGGENSVYDISGMSSISNSVQGPHVSIALGNENQNYKRMNKLINSFNFKSIPSSSSLMKNVPSFIDQTRTIKKTNFNLSKVRKINQKSLSKAISWSTSQFLSYQGKDTELFIDLHPPKSFEQLTSIKYSFSLNQPIGLVLCQIYSGLFYKQIAKNLLVVGPPGSEKSMLIQAIAGETELKIITDNAHRYALVFRGVAVGIKLLRDVFEALTLHTPCLFLLEDIHAIGERRPFLISDDENVKGMESSIYQDREEIHEKNQVAYQLTKHIISHYKKPYKGDFSLLIPTNHFCFDLFNSAPQNVQRTKTTNLTAGSPLAVNTKSHGSEKNTNAANQQMSGNSKKAKLNSYSFSDNSNSLASSLQLPKNQLLAPPATSPFSVLVLKEEKKLKPKKIVKEFPWAGLPGEQYANVSKATYSIRVKVALLADMVLSNLSVKLDMITDLLVIIDSVKGNRGFVVFATTHVPYILDPALRRPGRFDETLSLPQIPNLLSRWYISKSNISLWQYKHSSNPKLTISSLNYGEPFSIYPIGVSFSFWETNTYKYLAPNANKKSVGINTGVNNTLLSPSPAKADSLNLFKSLSKVTLTTILYPKHGESKATEMLNPVLNFSLKTHKRKNLLFLNETKTHSLKLINGQPNFRKPIKLSESTFSFPIRKGQESRNLFKKQTILTLKVYNIVSRLLISLQQSTVQLPYFNTQTKKKNWGDFSFNLRMASMPSNSFLVSCAYKSLSKDSLIYTSLYSAPHIFKQHLTILMAGQIGYMIAKGHLLGSNTGEIMKVFSNSNSFVRNVSNLAPQGVINLTTDKTWRTATSLVFSFIQKRWIYQRHLVIPRLLDFGFEGSKPDIPSPPSSNILLPAKRYENYRRTFTYSQLKHKTNSSISEKIQFHQQQRLIKRLYKIPLKEFFRSEILNNHINDTKHVMNENRSVSTPTTTTNSMNQFTSFSNASILLAPLENYQQKPTSTNWYFRNRLLNRHRTYLSNQWWNGQLREHNPESTFLSDIDWRYTIKSTKEGGIGDLFIDFPDAEQYYNPKNQRWINSSGSWNSWFDFHKSSYDLYSSHYIFECLTNAYKTLDQNRELLDYYVVNLLEKGLGTNKELNEIEILELFKNRF
jgi:hypothetical protein